MRDAGFTVAPRFALPFGLEPGFVVAPADLDAAFTVASPRFDLLFGLATGFATALADLNGRQFLDLPRNLVPLFGAIGLLGRGFGGGLRFFGLAMVRRNTAAKQYLACRRWAMGNRKT